MELDLLKLVKENPNINITVKGGELLEMADYCIQSTRKNLEQQITDANAETYPSRQKVAEILDVSLVTLHRWAKSGYLVPITVGGKRRYKMSDVTKLLTNLN